MQHSIKKILALATLAVLLLTAACGNQSVENEPKSTEISVSDTETKMTEQTEPTEPFDLSLTEETPVSAKNNTTLREKIGQNIADGMDVLVFSESDYNGDGKTEAFALVGEPESERSKHEGSDIRAVEYWFVSENRCEKLYTPESVWWYFDLPTETVVLTDSCGAWYSGMGPSPAGGHMIYYYYTVNRSGKPIPILKTSDGTLKRMFTKESDFLFHSNISHSKSESYFEFDAERCRLIEYGGEQITESQFKQWNNGTEIMRKIKNDGYTVESIYFRECGIVNLNYKQGKGYGFATYLTDKDGNLSPFESELTGLSMTPVFGESNYTDIELFDDFEYSVGVSYPSDFLV